MVFREGRVTALDAAHPPAPIELHTAAVCFGESARQFRFTVDEGNQAFVVGLEPGRTYQVEVEDEEVYEAAADPGGILEVEVPQGKPSGVRLK